MGTPSTSDLTPAVYAHHVRSFLARKAQADREAIGAHLTRGGFRNQIAKETRGRKTPVYGRMIDWFAASPLTGRDRQSGGFRVPHVDWKPITPTIAPTGKDGNQRAQTITALSAVQHVDYVTDGAKIGIGSHIDYIGRVTGIADPLGGLAMDALDELADRNEKNALGRYTNIPGGWSAARSLFEAAERAVAAPKTYELFASTADWETFAYSRRLASAPDWLRRMEERLRAEHDAVADQATKSGKPVRHRQVVVYTGTSEEAYDRLAWLDHHPGLSGKVDWKQGRTGRCQYRFVGELPYGLSARERHAILTEFGDLLGKDGWMVVGAIHQPDATNDKRNFHIHIDLFDRKAEWLEAEGCWDFAHVVRKNGKDARPLRHNKVRYQELDDGGQPRKFDVAGYMRSRFIDTVNAVVGDRSDIVRYLHGTYKDNGIELTPLEHMGNRAMGLEKRGIQTDVGSINARRAADDEAAACHARAAEAEAALAGELAMVRRIVAHDRQAFAAAERYERLKRRLIRRQLQAELAEVVIAMARSRADAVIRTLTPAPGHRIKSRSSDADLLADAKRHIEWVERHSPTPAEREAERRILGKLEHRAALEWKAVEAATARQADEQARTSITYLPRDRATTAAVQRPSRYDDQRRGRLTAWFRNHVTDPNLVMFEGDEVRLGKAVPLAIDTLMRHFAGEPSFQRRLIAERLRRATAGVTPVAASVSYVDTGVGMIPVDQWEWPKREGSGVAIDASSSTTAALEQSTGGDRSKANEERGQDASPSSLRASPDPKAIRRGALRERTHQLREDGWKMLESGKASIVRSADGYEITGMPAPSAAALLHKDFAAELERRLSSLSVKQPVSAPSRPEMDPAPTPRTRLPFRPIWQSAGYRRPEGFNGPPIALRDCPSLHAAVSLGRAPRLRDAIGLGKRIAFASDLAPPAQGRHAEPVQIAANPQAGGAKTSSLREQAKAEAVHGKVVIARAKGPASAARPVTPNKPGHER